MTKSLTGKVALVTGGSRGIGAASARALADEGADVAISYSASADKAEAVVRDLMARGVRAKAFKADQADSAQVERLVQDVAKEFGHLDILINNAGVAVSGAVDDPNGDTSALDRQTAINFDAVVTAIRSAWSCSVRVSRSVSVRIQPGWRPRFKGSSKPPHAIRRTCQGS